jgi:hypothetical protein
MAPERPLPVETLLPFSPARSPDQVRASISDGQRRDSTGQSPSPDSQDEDEGSGTDKPKRPKRSRACVACRNMKIRCLPVEGQEACNACSKVNRECVMPGPPRKRQKTVHKVAELEKKINALTNALLAKQQSNEDKTEESTPTHTANTEPTRTEGTSITTMDSAPPRKYIETTKTPQPVFVTGCEAAFGESSLRWYQIFRDSSPKVSFLRCPIFPMSR